ncbi:MAG: V-type ATP synthase subunit D [Lentisphaeria bacterium]|nr:V-type ATP synthase subunit D [Lentisphaeria bacterium]
MAKVKLTKTALKKERDDLKQFERFLPTLQLKKQQLQLEMRQCQDRIARNEQREEEARSQLSSWLELFGSEAEAFRAADLVKVERVETDIQNIAGVEVPRFLRVVFEQVPYDLFGEELWIDDAVAALRGIIELRQERSVIRKQYELIRTELRVTTQRVNLFEKIKIPQCRENIRRIGIYLGDMDTSAVVRSKIAKSKLQEAVA